MAGPIDELNARNRRWVQGVNSWRDVSPGEQQLASVIARREGGGRDYPGRNARSSASGPFGFTDSTFKRVIDRYPELGLSMSDKDDPEAQGKAIVALGRDNAAAFEAKTGRQPGIADSYGMHNLGLPSYLKLLNAPNDAKLSSVLPASYIAANPSFAKMTVADYHLSLPDAVPASSQDTGGPAKPLAAAGGTVPPPAPLNLPTLDLDKISPDVRMLAGNLMASGNVGAGMNLLNTAWDSVVNAEAARYKTTGPAQTRTIDLPGGKQQLQTWDGSAWTNDGAPSERWQPATPNLTQGGTVVDPATGRETTLMVDSKTGQQYAPGGNGQYVPYTPNAQSGTYQTQAPKLTEGQAKQADFATRAQSALVRAEQWMQDNPDYLKGSGFDQTTREGLGGVIGAGVGAVAGGALGGRFGGGFGGIGGAGVAGTTGMAAGRWVGEKFDDFAQRLLESDQGKEFDAVWSPFINATLRRDTGAAITKEEWGYGFKQYIPMPGDNAETLAIKAANRNDFIDGSKKGLPDGVVPPKPALTPPPEKPSADQPKADQPKAELTPPDLTWGY